MRRHEEAEGSEAGWWEGSSGLTWQHSNTAALSCDLIKANGDANRATHPFTCLCKINYFHILLLSSLPPPLLRWLLPAGCIPLHLPLPLPLTPCCRRRRC